MSDWTDDNQERKETKLPDLRLSAKFAAWDMKQILNEIKKISNTFDDFLRAFRKFIDKGGQS